MACVFVQGNRLPTMAFGGDLSLGIHVLTVESVLDSLSLSAQRPPQVSWLGATWMLRESASAHRSKQV